ncbi:hypothetical protein V498_07576 [Pseudogymnoascus sp. VKM F-4517 (FW-2822)]|nr:hypothetical protein V498_07576 [Pseudogymnoascus sp. VKM F-4517 (FW-2822)]
MASSKPKCLMYLTGQHNIVPDASLVSEITHVALAFMTPAVFNQPDPATASFPFFTSIAAIRSKFAAGTKVMVAIGGWGDTKGFSTGAATQESRKLFAQNIKQMVASTGADGVDIDWEYPGGNGEDWKQVPNTEKAWEIDAYPQLLADIRSALGPDKLISAAVPGLERDMLAFSKDNLSKINQTLDFFNIMTYDLMNRRDTVTKHHTGLEISLESINTYLTNGLPPNKALLGFAFYIKWFKIVPGQNSKDSPVGLKTVLMEDPVTGADLGQAGAFSWHDEVPASLVPSFNRAMEQGRYDDQHGGHYFLDETENRFWSWDTPEALRKKFPAVVKKLELGGVFAWGLGEDAPEWKHLKALTAGFGEARGGDGGVTPVDIDVVLEDTSDRQMVDVKLDKNRREKVPLYKDEESVRGAVTVRPKDGKRLEHTGIKVQFIGTIEMFFDRGNHYEFLSLGQELAAPGDLQHPQTFPFNFKNVEKQYESYNGINVKLRYFVRVTVSRRMADVIREKDIWVYSYKVPPETQSSIKMDVGIEDCLHIEFEYSKSKYHLKDVIVGRIYFLLVRLKIKHMELSIIRRETTGTAPNQYNESETLVRFEIMDGSPSRGETIPIRLFLGGFDLTPTFREVNKKYSTRYYLSLVLIDEDARRYFKQSEIVLYRQNPEIADAQPQNTQIIGAPPPERVQQ